MEEYNYNNIKLAGGKVVVGMAIVSKLHLRSHSLKWSSPLTLVSRGPGFNNSQFLDAQPPSSDFLTCYTDQLLSSIEHSWVIGQMKNETQKGDQPETSCTISTLTEPDQIGGSLMFPKCPGLILGLDS